MIKQIILFLTVLLSDMIYSQIGIGTDKVNPNIILQIESQPTKGRTYYGGLLAPRINLTATNVFAPVVGTKVTGLLVYNTASAGTGNFAVTPGFYFWNNSSLLWEKIAKKNAHETALFANQDTATDLNAGSTLAAIFANVRFNNNTNLYEKVDDTTIKINEIGYYKVVLNLDLASSGGADNFGVEIYVNNTSDIVSDNIYIPGRWDTEGGAEANFPNGRSFILYVPINQAGYTLSVRTYDIDPGTDVRFKNANTSTISIEKIR
ncbi:hypothetical protein HHL23_22350 [Chryseobacterium sp. RP-3-3]|uniref:Uncharacterized protein n=1 Tax=Chryseobacterium antibioticum TaxID=2728847 RepID=A0A7Y0FU42_9FLAO|nr:hypothetical protein [Chryseobacterium antibioticum]NML72495.1 hypothetical protein [Chryseobacterium antibioticum]